MDLKEATTLWNK